MFNYINFESNNVELISKNKVLLKSFNFIVRGFMPIKQDISTSTIQYILSK